VLSLSGSWRIVLSANLCTGIRTGKAGSYTPQAAKYLYRPCNRWGFRVEFRLSGSHQQLGRRIIYRTPPLEAKPTQDNRKAVQGLVRSAPGTDGRSDGRISGTMNEADLHSLMVRALAGDERAYQTFLAQVAAHLRPYFRRRLFEGPDQAEDLVQEVLIAVHTKRDTFDPTLPVTAWLYAIARFKLIDHLRRTKRRGTQVPIDDFDDLFATSDPEAGVARRDLDRLLDQLPPKQRDTIRMVKIEDMSVRETAERASISESDVKVSIHRGMKALSRIINKAGA
jgi:RNA polymerase sigma-70 factor, ECF subfamily